MKEKQTVKDNCLYFNITKQERDSAIRYLLGVIIEARQKENFPSNTYTFDEDVNVYLAHLLFAVALPDYHEMAEPYLSLDSSDILQWVRATEDRTLRYFIFKVNADHILIHSAIFGNLSARGQKKFFKKSPKHYKELSKLYYDQAAAYHKRIYRTKTGVGDVLQKLSQYFQAYQSLLTTVRRDYFNFMNSFRDQAFDQFMTQVKGYESEFQRDQKMDQFLELYFKWIQSKDVSLKPKIVRLSRELQTIDPEFKFDWDKDYIRMKGIDDDRKCA